MKQENDLRKFDINKPLKIRKFQEEDAEEASNLIKKTLREMNSKDYPPEVIDYLSNLYCPTTLKNISRERNFFLAEKDKKIIGTITLEHDYIGVLFIHPDYMNLGIGTLLMHHVEQIARENNIKKIRLNSSITAKLFYHKLGYELIKKNVHEDVGINYLMSKIIS